jgi:hypothetical protein
MERRPMLRAGVRSALMAVASLGGAQVAHSSNWDFNPRVELSGVFNDNYRLAQDSADKVRADGAMLDASLGMRLLTQTSEISLMPRVTTSYFPNDTSDDSTNGYLDIKGNHKLQKGDYGVVAQYANEEVIFSELLPANFPGIDLGQVVGSESGRVTALNRRELERLAPTMTYDITQRYHLHLDAEYLHASYDKNLFQQVGFQNIEGQAGLGYDISQKVTFLGTVIGTRYEPHNSDATNGYGVQSELQFHPTQIISYYVRLGALHSEAHVTGGDVSSTSITGGAGMTWTYQITQVVLDALRSVSPSSAGQVQNHSELRFRVIRALKPRLSGFVGARAIRLRSAVGGPIAVQGSDYLAATTGMEYQLTRSYRLAGEYDYTWQRFQGEPRAAANSIMVSIIYQPLSRFEPVPQLNGIPQERH